jgi:hypothetical protein
MRKKLIALGNPPRKLRAKAKETTGAKRIVVLCNIQEMDRVAHEAEWSTLTLRERLERLLRVCDVRVGVEDIAGIIFVDGDAPPVLYRDARNIAVLLNKPLFGGVSLPWAA